MSTGSNVRYNAVLNLSRKLKAGFEKTGQFPHDEMEVLSLGGGTMETLTQEELVMMIELATAELMQRSKLV